MSDPNPVIPDDPEAEGIPDVADDTSTAYDQPDKPRLEDSPVSLPVDRPVAVDDYGVTPEEGRHDEPLSARLMREEPDISPDDPETAAAPDLADEATSETAATWAARDADVLGAGLAENLDSPPDEQVGRLVEPDEGVREDDEAESIAYDSGEHQGLSAEEAAMHIVPDSEL